MIDVLLHNYSMFFDWGMWAEVLSSPEAWMLILTLVFLEGILSADNALVLAVMVKHLPEKQQKRALKYGLFGAYFFRFLAIGLGTLIISLWWIKAIGALYLAYLVYKHFFKKEDETAVQAVAKGFWMTVLSVELMDIAFSIDSVLAAFGISEQIWVLFAGAVLGILAMRLVAGVFLKLLAKFPTMEHAAYIIIGFIAAKMLLSLAHIHISHVAFFIFLVAVFTGAIFIDNRNAKKAGKAAA
jgi:YkoY family integral membrane protein